MNECRNLAAEVASGRLSQEEMDELMQEINAFQDDLFGGQIERAQKIAEDAAEAARIERRNRMINMVVERRLLDLARVADEQTGDPALGLQSALVGVNTPFEGAQRSVDSLAQGLMAKYGGGLIADLRKRNLLSAFNRMSTDMERDVARVMSDLNKASPEGVKVSADARAIAEIMHKYQSAAVDRQNRAGAYIRKRDGYVVRQSHDPGKMQRAGLDAWKDSVRNKIDVVKMDLGPDELEDFLDSAFLSLTSGVRLTQQVSDISVAFTGPRNLAKKDSASRVILFKNSDDWMDYNQEFGTGSLRESYMQGLSSSARSTALMSQFGTNPQAMLDRVTALLEQKHRDDPKKLKGIRGTLLGNIQAQMDEVTGDVNIGAHTTAARINTTFRAVQTMAKLGGSAISALSDVAFLATNRMYQGQSVTQSWTDALTAAVEGFSKGEKREFADLMGAGIEGQLGDFMSRFNTQDSVAGRTSKLMSVFFKLNLLGPWTDANKRGVTFMISRDLAKNATMPFDQLPPDLNRLLKIYGMDARKWEVARLAVRKADDGREYLMPGDVQNVSGKPFSGLSQDQQRRLRDEVSENLFALLTTEADFSVPSSGARERAIMRQGYRPGTISGEAVRFVGQFKSFGITALTKVLGRQVYGHTPGKAQLRGNLGLVNAIAGTTVLGYFIMQAKEMMKGREPRPMDAKAFVAAALQGGGLGIYGDFLFGEANRFGGGTLGTIAGPSIGAITQAVDTLQMARFGDATGADFINLAKGNIPFANLFYVKGALDYLLWYQLQEMVNPGYLRRMERRVKRENNQTYWLPPTSMVATGGGFK